MSLIERLILWLAGLVIGLVPLLAAVLLSGTGWTHTIDHGELVLVIIPVLTSAVAYAAMSPLAEGFPSWVKAVVIGVGLVVVLFAALSYWSFSEIAPEGGAISCLTKNVPLTPGIATKCLREPTTQLSRNSIATLSYVLVALGVVVAVLSIVSHRDAPTPVGGELS